MKATPAVPGFLHEGVTMLKTMGPVIIMTKAELEAMIDAAVKKAVVEAMKAIDTAPRTTKPGHY